MKVLFVHPDLGVGGAERLIVDAALAVKQNGHEVSILTNHYDPKHCFDDTKNLNIIQKFPLSRHIFGKFHAFLAYLKIFLASLWLVLFSNLKFDIVIVDQISLPVYVFRTFKIKCLFYCHFPDQLLCVYDKRKSPFKRIYRSFINWVEMKTTSMADVILVNSKFTSQIFYKTFSSLADKKIEVLYPSLNTELFDTLLDQYTGELVDSNKDTVINEANTRELEKSKNKKFLFLSINRYERKKDLKLAIEAMKKLKDEFIKTGNDDKWSSTHLIMAGGYDYRVKENVDHYEELVELAKNLEVIDNISFLRSISDKLKVNLLKKSFSLLYTPTNEHFGIVPIEAMYCEKPVIATNTGGPLETVAHLTTGYLVESNPNEFAKSMSDLINEPKKQNEMGIAARKRVINNFSFISFQNKLNNILTNMNKDKKNC